MGKQKELIVHCSEKHTRVVCNTFPNRGKSLTPESRIEILDDRSAFVDRNDDTQEAKGFAIALHTPSRIPLPNSMDNVIYVYATSLLT